MHVLALLFCAMLNPLTNPSFEQSGLGWRHDFGIITYPVVPDAADGIRVAQLADEHPYNSLFFEQGDQATPLIPPTGGPFLQSRAYYSSVRVRWRRGSSPLFFIAGIHGSSDPSATSIAKIYPSGLVQIMDGPPGGAGAVREEYKVQEPRNWFLVQTRFVPDTTTSDFIYRLLMDFPTSAGPQWEVDACKINDEPEPEMITKLLRDAILADLADITAANNFATTIAQVYGEPGDATEWTLPCAILRTEEGGPSGQEEGQRTRVPAQSFEIELQIQSDTPHDAIANFFDDARNCVERRNSNLLNVVGVSAVRVTGWDKVETVQQQGQSLASQTLTIAVDYRYAAGAS